MPITTSATTPKTEGRPCCIVCKGWGPREERLLRKPWTCSACRWDAKLNSAAGAATVTRKIAPTNPGLVVVATPAIAAKSEHARGGKLFCIDAAAQVLKENGGVMSCLDMIDRMAATGLWVSPGGKTPAATLYSAIGRDIAGKGQGSRFVSHGKGNFKHR